MNKRKIRRTLSILLLLTAITVTQIPVSDAMAQAVASDFQLDGKTLIKYTGTTEPAVSIPSGVKIIADGAFSGHNELVKVTIGSEVEKIGNAAFADCKSLRTVQMGDSVKEIDSGAFSGCLNLVSVGFGAGVSKLGNGVFAGSEKLKSMTIDSKNAHLVYRNGVIYDIKMTTVYQLLPGYDMQNYEVPSTVTQIRGYAFWGNPYLKNVTMGSKLSEIPAYAFSNCVNLAQVVVPYSVRNIGAKAFEDCVNLKSVNLPESVTSINATAFDGCFKVKFTTVPGSYGAEYVAGRDVSQAAQAEQTELDTSTVVSSDAPAQDATASTAPGTSQDTAASATPGASQETAADEEAASSQDVAQEITTDPAQDENILGKSSIVSGRALVFIDNQGSMVYSGSAGNYQSEEPQNSEEQDPGNLGSFSAGTSNPLSGVNEKGFGFPKYTIVEDKIIANQAYYQDTSLSSYEIPAGITQIGDFSFARTTLKKIEIPLGVERIGYGAFYHCDSLSDVTVPNTVTEIEPSAFDHTAWIRNWQNQVGQDYLVVGDGVLLAYSGQESVVNIPAGVKRIGAGVFKDHMGITAVNLPKGLLVIGEEAFAGCRNLKTVNGGETAEEIRDRAFLDCALDQINISENVKKIGLRAFDLSDAGTKTVTFAGNTLPKLSEEKTALRLSNQDYRGLAFGKIEEAFISGDITVLTDTVLDDTLLGFRGKIRLPDGTIVKEMKSTAGSDVAEGAGVTVRITSSSLMNKGIASATIPGTDGSYLLKISDSDGAAAEIRKAYGSLYGGGSPSGLLAYDITLYEQPGNGRIARLGKQYMTVLLPKPEGLGTENLHVVCLDANGQLEEVAHQIVQTEEAEGIQFTVSHLSPYGIYQYSGAGTEVAVKDGVAVFGSLSGKKDESPETGDWIHPKWLLAFGLLCTAAGLYFYKGKKISMLLVI